jgi:hypothetical protein
VEEDGEEDDPAQPPGDKESGGDGDSVEEGMDEKSGEDGDAAVRMNEFVMVGFFAEMKMRSYGVFEEMDQQVSAEDDEPRTGATKLDTGGNHFHDGGGEHESGTERHKVLEVALLPIALDWDKPAEEVGESGGEAESQAE